MGLTTLLTRKASHNMASANVIELTGANWDEEVVKSDKPVLVDFWAAWCPPCRRLAPTLEALAGAYEGQVTVLKVNVDESPEVSSRYGIQSIPTLILFRDGRMVDRRLGALPMDELRRFVDAHLVPAAAIA